MAEGDGKQIRESNRRNFLKLTGATGIAGLAGCIGGDGDGGTPTPRRETVVRTVEGEERTVIQTRVVEDEVYKGNLATASEGGAFRVVGAGLAQIWNEHENLNITPITTAGDLDNASRIARDEVQIAINDAYHAWLRVMGESPFEEPFDMNTLFRMFTNQNWFVVREDSGMTQVTDLDGKSVGSGPRGSGANVDTTFFLEELAGLDIDYRYQSFSDAAQAIANNQLDSMLVYGILPAVQQLSQQVDIRPLEWPTDLLNTALEHPAIRELEFPTFVDWWDEPIPTPAKDILITCRPDIPESAAYNITRQTFENVERAQEIFVLLRALNIDDAPRNVGGDLPIHPGAQRYYEEQGVL